MSAREFCYWLQGYFEIHGETDTDIVLTGAQIDMIRRHLALVFKHEIDPSYGGPEKQGELQKIHDRDVKKLKKDLEKKMEEIVNRPSFDPHAPIKC